MMLGEFECDEETAYFLKHGKHMPLKERCKQSQFSSDPEYDEELYREFIESNNFEWERETTYRYALWY